MIARHVSMCHVSQQGLLHDTIHNPRHNRYTMLVARCLHPVANSTMMIRFHYAIIPVSKYKTNDKTDITSRSWEVSNFWLVVFFYHFSVKFLPNQTMQCFSQNRGIYLRNTSQQLIQGLVIKNKHSPNTIICHSK